MTKICSAHIRLIINDRNFDWISYWKQNPKNCEMRLCLRISSKWIWLHLKSLITFTHLELWFNATKLIHVTHINSRWNLEIFSQGKRKFQFETTKKWVKWNFFRNIWSIKIIIFGLSEKNWIIEWNSRNHIFHIPLSYSFLKRK